MACSILCLASYLVSEVVRSRETNSCSRPFLNTPTFYEDDVYSLKILNRMVKINGTLSCKWISSALTNRNQENGTETSLKRCARGNPRHSAPISFLFCAKWQVGALWAPKQSKNLMPPNLKLIRWSPHQRITFVFSRWNTLSRHLPQTLIATSLTDRMSSRHS